MNHKIGLAIKNARRDKGLTQLQLAARTNISISTISAIELNKLKSVSTATLELIGKELGLTFEI